MCAWNVATEHLPHRVYYYLLTVIVKIVATTTSTTEVKCIQFTAIFSNVHYGMHYLYI